jgi:hypothetical protein
LQYLKAKPERIKYYKKFRHFHHFYRLNFSTIKLVPVALLYQINQIFGRLVLLLPVKG